MLVLLCSVLLGLLQCYLCFSELVLANLKFSQSIGCAHTAIDGHFLGGARSVRRTSAAKSTGAHLTVSLFAVVTEDRCRSYQIIDPVHGSLDA